jgi:hypothetical protein
MTSTLILLALLAQTPTPTRAPQPTPTRIPCLHPEGWDPPLGGPGEVGARVYDEGGPADGTWCYRCCDCVDAGVDLVCPSSKGTQGQRHCCTNRY